ncbi:MAG: FAD-dependent oxidoreductase [Bryobacterales bacterium]|nr:FAD-dependent oxidoreductase [Bryobacterales bacterium]
MASVVIVGLGLSGLGCALELVRRRIPFAAYEKENAPGGLARTDAAGGFRFDYGPHILLELPGESDAWFSGLPGLDLLRCTGASGVALGARLESVIPAPFQQNLNWLPLHVRARILFDAVARIGRKEKPPGAYSEYALARCGRGIYDLFLRGYDSKRLRFPLDQMPADWTNRIEKPWLRSLMLPRSGARLPGAGKREGRFFYPRSGGIEALPRAMANLLPEGSLRYGSKLMEIDPRLKLLAFTNGTVTPYEHLVLSLPLPEIVALLKQSPPEVRGAAENLLYTSIYVLNAGIDGPVPPWFLLRIPDSALPFYRLSFPSHYSPDSAPEGKAIVVGEISHHPIRHFLSPGDARRQFDQGLRRMGILQPGQRILVETIRDIQYGHVLYNHATRASIRLILEYLRAGSIFTCGKYGQWRDMLIPKSILTGLAAAREIAALVTGPG